MPAKRVGSTWVSAAMMTRSAAAICSGVNWFLAPTEPWVSTAISSPAAAAAFLSASAAMKVWAMPVGQAVMATMRRPVLTGSAPVDRLDG